ncbi:hypothetical protein ACVWWO_003411 [Bradyrhizobium sp. F1.13.1]
MQRTLLQSLNVRAVVDAKGNETSMFEVPAGAIARWSFSSSRSAWRRCSRFPVSCARAASLKTTPLQTDERIGLQALEQFRAFQTLSDAGMSYEDIAARNFVTPAVVKQRLRLASLSPKLHDVYAEDGMTLEQLMAFTVTADHARQEQLWDNVSPSGYDEPDQIRQMLTENTLRASDRQVQFIGLDAYEQAGGGVFRDLFQHDDGGWLQTWTRQTLCWIGRPPGRLRIARWHCGMRWQKIPDRVRGCSFSPRWRRTGMPVCSLRVICGQRRV